MSSRLTCCLRPQPAIRSMRSPQSAERRSAAGFVYDVASDCFRREPSKNIDRMQTFRMREFVAIGAPEMIRGFREHWMARAPEIAGALGVAHRIEAASDPFFGRAGAARQPLSGRAVAEVRNADPRALRRAADGLHELQLSPRAFRRGLGDRDAKPASRRTPPASPSASTVSRLRCSPPTASRSPPGRKACATRCGYKSLSENPFWPTLSTQIAFG